MWDWGCAGVGIFAIVIVVVIAEIAAHV